MRKTVRDAGVSSASTVSEPDAFEDLLRLAKKGDADAFSSLWTIFQPGLLRYLRVIGGQAAEDLAADTWLQVIRKLTTFDGNDKAFRAWICTIARNRHIDWRRQMARRRESLVESDVLDRIPTLDDTETSMSTHRAVALIATLPPDQAEAVMLRTVAGLSVSAVAEIMGRPAGTVRVLCHRGLRRLAFTLEGIVPDEASGAKNSQATEVVV
jgi:RNA polymerase sigma-70 factor (ECF subfamily)